MHNIQNVFKDPETREIKINGQCIPLIDCVSMLEHNKRALDNIRETRNLWNTSDSRSGNRYYFIDDKHRICGPKKLITEFIKRVNCVNDDWKKKNLRILNLNQEVYRKYCQMMTWKIKKDNRFENMSCIDQMTILKAMGNDIRRAGMCNNSALSLYRIAVKRWGNDDGSHTSCKGKAHDDLLSKLYNNLSIIEFERNEFEKSAVYAKLALILNPRYQKCSRRIILISKKIDLLKLQEGKAPII